MWLWGWQCRRMFIMPIKLIWTESFRVHSTTQWCGHEDVLPALQCFSYEEGELTPFPQCYRSNVTRSLLHPITTYSPQQRELTPLSNASPESKRPVQCRGGRLDVHFNERIYRREWPSRSWFHFLDQIIHECRISSAMLQPSSLAWLTLA